MAAVYPFLFRPSAEKYNWAFRDFHPDFTIIQQSFLFSLWLFHRFGNEWRSLSFYEDHFLKAFPLILSEAESESYYTTPEEVVRSCYSWRCLEGFAVFRDYPRFRDETFLGDFLERNRDNDGYRWVLARFLEHGRVVDTFRFFTAGEIASEMDRIRISSYARKKWTRMLEVYG